MRLVAGQLVEGDAEGAGDGLRDGERRLGFAGLVAADLSAIHADLGGQVALRHA